MSRNTQIIDTCIVFPQWHIRSNFGFVVSFFVIVALGVFYEWLRAFSRRVDRSIARSLAAGGKGKARVSARGSPSPTPEDAGLLTGRRSFKSSSCVAQALPRLIGSDPRWGAH